MGSRLIRSISLVCAGLLLAVTLRVGDRDFTLTAALIALIALALFVTFRSFRDPSGRGDDQVRREIAELNQRLAAVEGKVEAILELLPPELLSRVPQGRSHE
jgi:hypothetical protein